MNNKLLIFLLFLLISLSVSLVLIFQAGREINYQDQAKYFDHLRNVGAIIFAVSGAWLALAYPKAIASADRARAVESSTRVKDLDIAEDDNRVLLGFVKTMIISIFVVGISMILPFLKEVASAFSYLLPFTEYFRGALYVLIFSLTLVQLGLLGLTLRSAYLALAAIRKSVGEARIRKDREQNSSH